MNDPRLEIRQVELAHPDAARLVAEVQQEYVVRYGGPDQTPLDAGELSADRGRLFVGYDAGLPAVMGAWRWHPPVEGIGPGPCVEVKRMYVAAAHRHRGHARAMLAHLESTAAEAGAATVILETGTAQPEAIALYESSGYVPIPSFGFYRDSPSNRCFAKPCSPPA